jgi:hypothetical protein
MIRFDLPDELTLDVIEELNNWCHTVGGYIGESDIYFGKNGGISFKKTAYFSKEEDLTAFKLRFGL